MMMIMKKKADENDDNNHKNDDNNHENDDKNHDWNRKQLKKWTDEDDWTKNSATGSHLNAYLTFPAKSIDKKYRTESETAANMLSGDWIINKNVKRDFWSSKATLTR